MPGAEMTEADAIFNASTRGPATERSLADDLTALGLNVGDVVIVHSSLSRLGWVAGGAVAVARALRAAVGDEGTLVAPTHTTELTDPRHWCNPPVPEQWWEAIRAEMSAFDPRVTPSREMGAIAEVIRTSPGAVRSDHPVGSFAAIGPRAGEITARHPLEDVFGERSPLGRLYELKAKVLLLGVGHDNNTSLHLAEVRAGATTRRQGSPVLKNGRREWVTYNERDHDSDEFPAIAKAFEAEGGSISRGPVGAGTGELAGVREMVDFATKWLVDRG